MALHYTEITACRICGNRNLVEFIDLGYQYLTGVFPKKRDCERLTKGPLQVVKCHSEMDDACGLLQLRHSYSPDEMYGENCGYRSGLNSSANAAVVNAFLLWILFLTMTDGTLDSNVPLIAACLVTLAGSELIGKWVRSLQPHLVR